MNLHPDQLAALALATDSRGPRIAIIAGAPGTGKTTTIRAILDHFERRADKVALAAPTGKAALRITQQTGRPACTIHRLLEPTRLPSGRFAFARGMGYPLELRVLILDECSMIDVELAAKVLEALAFGARLILIGDVDQLPPVGPGAFLGDLIASGIAPVARLDTIKRQNPGALLTAIHTIKAGRAPRIANVAGEDLFLEEVGGVDEACGDETAGAGRILSTILDLVLDRLPASLPALLAPDALLDSVTGRPRPLDPLRDIQVIAPKREKGEIACKAINEAIQERLLPEGTVEAHGRLRRGDKVIQLKNDYERSLCNGDIGFIVGFGTDDESGKKTIEVLFDSYPDRGPVPIIAAEHRLDLAYAVTCHKFQGSEAPVIVIPIHSSDAFMLTRNWVYTAISRARSFCVIVGEREALAKAVRRTSPTMRTTTLLHQLRAEGAARAARAKVSA